MGGCPRERGVEDGDRDQEHPEAGGDHQHHVEAVDTQPGHQKPPGAAHAAEQLKWRKNVCKSIKTVEYDNCYSCSGNFCSNKSSIILQQHPTSNKPIKLAVDTVKSVQLHPSDVLCLLPSRFMPKFESLLSFISYELNPQILAI